MKSISYPQFRIVESDSAKDLTEELNRIVKDLKDKNPQVTFDGSLTARITYTVTENSIPEDLSDEYRIQGVKLYCNQCPLFERVLKRDGTPDYRKNFGTCPFQGVVHKDECACEKLFEMMNSGAVKLCLEN